MGNRNDSVMLAPTLDSADGWGLLAEIETLWLDRGDGQRRHTSMSRRAWNHRRGYREETPTALPDSLRHTVRCPPAATVSAASPSYDMPGHGDAHERMRAVPTVDDA